MNSYRHVVRNEGGNFIRKQVVPLLFFLKLTKVGHLKLIDECLSSPYNKQLSCEGIFFTLLLVFFEMEVGGTHSLLHLT